MQESNQSKIAQFHKMMLTSFSLDIIGNKGQYLNGCKIQPTQKQKRGIAHVILRHIEG